MANAKNTPKNSSKSKSKTTSKTSKSTVTKSAKATTPKTSKPARKASTAKTTTNKSNKPVIAYIVGAVAAIALVVIGIIALASSINTNGKTSLTVKDGDGEKIATQYLGFDDFSFRLKVPTSFHTMSSAEIEKKYGKDNAPQTVYTNDDNSVNIAIDPTDDKVSNDQVKTHLNTIKSVLNLGGEIIKDDYYTQGNHNIASIQLITADGNTKYYNYMIFFSQNDNLTRVTFNCKEDVRNKWEPVAKFVMESIDFTK